MPSLTSARGLVTFRNELRTPEGALKKADNIVIDEDDVIEFRRGFGEYGDEFPLASDRAKQLLVYKDTLLRHFQSTLQYDSDGSGTFLNFDGTYEELTSGLRIKGLEANSNFYFTTIEGIKKISATSAAEFTTTAGYITPAGVVKALDITAALTADPLGFLAVNESAAYRLVWGIKDTNNNLILGAPSSRLVITNTAGGPQSVTISAQIPQDIVNTNYFYQLYRTAVSGVGIDPGDEMRLVYEEVVSSAELTAGFITPIVDNLDDVFRDANLILYTNENTGEGILQSNERPPIATDVALFRGSVFYANTKTVHSSEFTLLSATGLHAGEFVIENEIGLSTRRIFTFAEYDSSINPNPSTPTVAGGIVGVDTNATFSAAQLIDIATRNLVNTINQDVDCSVYAFYTSGVDTLPGQVRLENRTLEDITFYLATTDTVSIANKFDPTMPEFNVANPIPTSNPSSNDEAGNRIYFSKTDQPEAVPLVNYINVGPKDKIIQRIIALRDNLFVLKDDGIYIVTGSTAPNFAVRLLDNSTTILAPDSGVVLNNQIYCLTDQGIATITETGVSIVSRQIENLILGVANSRYNYKYTTFGVSYESDRAYIVWLPEKTTDTVATQAFRYNTFTNTWTRWTRTQTCGVVNSGDDKLYVGAGDRNLIEQERKNKDRTDYADKNFDVALVSGGVSVNVLTVSSISGIEKGDALFQKQYITIAQYNRLLRKLDLDPGLADSISGGGAGYVNSVGLMVSGDNLQLKLQSLDNSLAADANIGVFTPTVYSSDFATQQTEFNSFIAQLNTIAVGTFYKNYKESTGSTYYETLITNVDAIFNKLTTVQEFPFLFGLNNPLVVYKMFQVDVEWQPQHFGAPDKMKQVSESTIIFDQNNFYSAEVFFQSDLSRTFEGVEFFGEGSGVFGFQNWGEFIFGGQGADVPLRTLVPREKQRCRYLTIRFKHANAREGIRLLGISMEPRLIGTRAYR